MPWYAWLIAITLIPIVCALSLMFCLTVAQEIRIREQKGK
jgi:hypothetical protein